MVWDEHGVLRFRGNAIVKFLLEAGPFDMNTLARMPFSRRDREQFAQLIGYSVIGFSELPYVRDETWEKVEVRMEGMIEERKGNT